jgi:hypothetical protein
MKPTDHVGVRRFTFALAVVTSVTAVAAQVIEGPSGSGYGWGAVVISCILVAVPLLVIGLMVLSGEARYARVALIVIALLVALVVTALIGNWAGQSLTARWLDSVVAVLVLALTAATLAAEIPLLRHRSGSPPGGRPMSHQR